MGGGDEGGRDVRKRNALGPDVANAEVTGGSGRCREGVQATRSEGEYRAGDRPTKAGAGYYTDKDYWRLP